MDTGERPFVSMMRAGFILLISLSFSTFSVLAQVNAPFCGVVEAIDYPIDDLVQGYDDFAVYRERFGGNHLGIDIGFDRWGDPVRAVARGRVTLADIEEWDTEKGVVVLEHTFPDGSLVYTLYGHMEESDEIKFPPVGSCVEQGDIVGVIGWPSRGRPHLHYEVRRLLPGEGGPGYITTNPLDNGWFHPLDFTELWRMRLQPGFIRYASFKAVPALPPVMLDNGTYAVASGNHIEGTTAEGNVLWRVDTDGVISGLAALSGGRVAAHTQSGQALTLENGRYAALWRVDALDVPFLKLEGDTLVFGLAGGGVAAYDAAGALLWSHPAIASAERLADFQTNGQQVALGVRTDDDAYAWRLLDAAGQVVYETTFENAPVTAADRLGNWVALDGEQIRYFVGGANHTMGETGTLPGLTATMTVDVLGNSYVYMGDDASTLASFDAGGASRWRVEYPVPPVSLPPLMATGNGCLLYTLDVDGTLNVFETATGELVNQTHLYAGGRRSSSPRARLLRIDPGEQVHVSSGFLTLVTLDGWALGGEAAANCLLG